MKVEKSNVKPAALNTLLLAMMVIGLYISAVTSFGSNHYLPYQAEFFFNTSEGTLSPLAPYFSFLTYALCAMFISHIVALPLAKILKVKIVTDGMAVAFK